MVQEAEQHLRVQPHHPLPSLALFRFIFAESFQKLVEKQSLPYLVHIDERLNFALKCHHCIAKPDYQFSQLQSTHHGSEVVFDVGEGRLFFSIVEESTSDGAGIADFEQVEIL